MTDIHRRKCIDCNTLIRNNAKRCSECVKLWKKQGANKYEVGDVFIWIRANGIVRAVKNGKDISWIYIGKEVIE